LPDEPVSSGIASAVTINNQTSNIGHGWAAENNDEDKFRLVNKGIDWNS
jgi:hypothetical protein